MEKVRLDEGIDCLAPSVLGTPNLHGFLWVRQKGAKVWTRRFVLQKANFLFWFAEKDAGAPIKALGAVCFEDLVFEWIEPAPVEKEVAHHRQHAFRVQPNPPSKTKAGDRRTVDFCAESEMDMQQWTKALVIWKFDVLSEDRNQLSDTRGELNQCRLELREARSAASAVEDACGKMEVEIKELRAALSLSKEAQAEYNTNVETLQGEVHRLRETLDAPRGGSVSPEGGHGGFEDGRNLSRSVSSVSMDEDQLTHPAALSKNRSGHSSRNVMAAVGGSGRNLLAAGNLLSAGSAAAWKAPAGAGRKASTTVVIEEVEEMLLSDVSDEEALDLLSRTQECASEPKEALRWQYGSGGRLCSLEQCNYQCRAMQRRAHAAYMPVQSTTEESAACILACAE